MWSSGAVRAVAHLLLFGLVGFVVAVGFVVGALALAIAVDVLLGLEILILSFRLIVVIHIAHQHHGA